MPTGSNAATHELKLDRKWFKAITSLVKTFEVRRNDRNYQVGDILKLKEWSDQKGFTGNEGHFRVTYIGAFSPGVVEGYVVMAIEPAYPKGAWQIHRERNRAIFDGTDDGFDAE